MPINIFHYFLIPFYHPRMMPYSNMLGLNRTHALFRLLYRPHTADVPLGFIIIIIVNYLKMVYNIIIMLTILWKSLKLI